jgi:hypothetical protein
MFREDALPIRAVVVIVVDVSVARLTAFRCDRVIRRYLRHPGSLFVDGTVALSRRVAFRTAARREVGDLYGP